MRYLIFILVAVTLGCINQDHAFLQTSEVQLSDPIAKLDSMIFLKLAKLNIRHSIEDSEIHYSMEGAPYQLMNNSISIKTTTEVEYFAKKKGFQNSDTLNLVAIKSNNKLLNASISIHPSPSSKYPGFGAESLLDLKKGSINFSSNNNWMGFQDDKIKIILDLEKEVSLQNIKLSVLDDSNSWIYLPNKITVMINNETVGQKIIPLKRQKTKSSNKYIDIPLPNQKHSELNIIIELMSKIPKGFPGAGNKPWLFIDEIIFN